MLMLLVLQQTPKHSKGEKNLRLGMMLIFDGLTANITKCFNVTALSPRAHGGGVTEFGKISSFTHIQ